MTKMVKKALITGITGQDGSYLAEFLLSKCYEVYGLIRRASTFNTYRIDHIYVDPHEPSAQLFLHYGDLSDSEQISNILHKVQPDEVYHLGAQSHVKVSFDMPEYTARALRFRDLVKIMVDADMRKAGLQPVGEGDEFLRKQFPNRWWRVD